MSRLLVLVEKEDEDHIDEKTQIGDKNEINGKELRDSPKEPRACFRRVGVQGRAAWAICPGWPGWACTRARAYM